MKTTTLSKIKLLVVIAGICAVVGLLCLGEMKAEASNAKPDTETTTTVQEVGTIDKMSISVPEYGTITIDDVKVYTDSDEAVWSYTNSKCTVVIDTEQAVMTIYDDNGELVGNYNEFSTSQE